MLLLSKLCSSVTAERCGGLADDPGACMGVAARAMFEAEFTQAIAIGKWRAVLEGVRVK
jgi:hypothetical protein